MADEQDSGSCVGYHVWVQVPSSALAKKEVRRLPFLILSRNPLVSCVKIC